VNSVSKTLGGSGVASTNFFGGQNVCN